MSFDRFDVVVLGGGINGLSAVHHLRRRSCGRIGMIEQFTVGHDRGSSHGKARIIRSTYVSADYVRLVQAARREEWARLERETGKRLIFPTPGCFFGPPGKLFDRHAAAVDSAGADVERLTPAEGRKLFPWFHFENAAGVLHDRTSGVIAAEDAINALRALAVTSSVAIRENTKVFAIDRSKHPLQLVTSRGIIETERLLVTAGAWTRQLVPGLGDALSIARQTVGYFRVGGPRGGWDSGFPVWVYLEDGDNNVYYGLPEFGRAGIKVGRHVTGGKSDDPDHVPAEPSQAELKALRAFLEARFAVPVEDMVGFEHCLYTNTPTEDLILDLLPGDPRIAIGSACSGHGFKFGPLTGRILVELALDGKTTIPEFEAMRQTAAFPSRVAST